MCFDRELLELECLNLELRQNLSNVQINWYLKLQICLYKDMSFNKWFLCKQHSRKFNWLMFSEMKTKLGNACKYLKHSIFTKFIDLRNPEILTIWQLQSLPKKALKLLNIKVFPTLLVCSQSEKSWMNGSSKISFSYVFCIMLIWLYSLSMNFSFTNSS